MALSDNDHIQALRNRLLNVEKDLEKEYQNRLSEIREMIRVLDSAPDLLSKLPLVKALEARRAELATSKPQSGKRTLANRNVTALTREWLADHRKMDEKIEINEIVTFLRGKGVTGKERSLYSAVHVILKKEEAASRKSPNPPWLRYKARVGFYKTWKDEDTLIVS